MIFAQSNHFSLPQDLKTSDFGWSMFSTMYKFWLLCSKVRINWFSLRKIFMSFILLYLFLFGEFSAQIIFAQSNHYSLPNFSFFFLLLLLLRFVFLSVGKVTIYWFNLTKAFMNCILFHFAFLWWIFSLYNLPSVQQLFVSSRLFYFCWGWFSTMYIFYPLYR